MGAAEGSHPPDVSEGVERNVMARGDVEAVSFELLKRECFDVSQNARGSASVRTRNTLHVVGARLSAA